MDFPKSVPNVGLDGGKFVDENTVTGTPGSLIPAQWGNAVTTEILGVIQESGATPDESNNLQLVAAVKQIAAQSKPGAATQGVAGVIKLATSSDVTEGTDDSKAVTPLRLFQRLSGYFVQATETVLGLVKIATQVLTNAGVDDKTSVTPKKLAVAVQGQAFTAFTTAGSAPAFTLEVTPAVTAYAPNQRFQVAFHASGGANPTLNISGVGPKSLKQYDSTATKVSAFVVNGQISDVVYDGTDLLVVDSLPPQVNNLVGTQGAFKNLTVSATGTSSVVSITVDEIVLENAAGSYQTVRSVAVNPNISASGISGLDVGTVAASTWYSVWVVWSSTNGAAGLLSLRATDPTLPGGWTHKARVSWVRTDSSGRPLNFIQVGRRAQYRVGSGTNLTVLPVISNAVAPVSLWTPLAVAAFVPPTAGAIDVGVISQSAASQLAWAYVVPNNSYSTTPSATSPVAIGSGSYNSSLTATRTLMTLESTNIYWGTLTSSGGSMGVYCAGWEDNL